MRSPWRLLGHPRTAGRGGLLHLLQEAVRVEGRPPARLARQAFALAAATWTPLVIAGAVDAASGLRPPPLLLDLSVHARLLVAIPVLLLAAGPRSPRHERPQTFNDLLGAVGSLDRIRPLPVEPRELLGVVIAAALPMVPLVLTKVPLPELLLKLVGSVIGLGPG